MYDTLYLTRECIRQRGVTGHDLVTDRVAIRDCWAHMKDAEAPLTGATTINADGETVRKPTILLIEAGRMTSVH